MVHVYDTIKKFSLILFLNDVEINENAACFTSERIWSRDGACHQKTTYQYKIGDNIEDLVMN